MLSFLGIGVAPMGKCSAFSRPFVSRSPLALSMPAGKYHLTRTRVAMVFLVQYVSLTSFIAWGLYLWVNVKHYGSQPECNHQIKYVVFFFTVRATANWLRRLWIAMFSILCLSVLLGWFATLATIIFAMKRTNEEEEVEEMNSWSHVVDYSYFKVDTTRLFSAIYSTVMLELTIARNRADILPDGTNIGRGVVQVDDAWEFGQVLSVVMIFVNFKEVLHYIFRVYSLVYEE
ncbi:hypothetical protein DFH94DRAFT_754051 [Russula ochroleuca]|uniref:Uncharacterized protein n=1 Tax=Russula ochroleuca TaxID=152965 RepID=A0A9P5MTK7_9AGAM|nr:hypothetical protein DFH94DRAFT_754051 [Russula ochroleuca]